jgi:DNA repair protein RAD50
LKTRFDEIFAATKYIKALDILKKVRLEKTHIINQVKVEKNFLEKYKTNAEKLTTELESGQARKEKLLNQKVEIDEKLKPLQTQIDKFLQESAQIFEIKNEMDKIQNEIVLLEKQMRELLVQTKHCIFQGTDEQLKQMIAEVESTTIQSLEEEQEAINDKQDNFYLKQKEVNDKRTKLRLDIAQIENKTMNLASKKKDLADAAKKACKLIRLDSNELFTDAKNPNDFDRDLLNRLYQEYIDKHDLKVRGLEKTAATEEETLQHEINEQRDEKSKLDQNILIKEENTLKAKQELEKLNSELKQVSDDKLLTKLNEQIETLDEELTKKSSNLVDADEIKQEIKDYEKKQVNLRLVESDLDARISKLHLNSKAKTEIDLLVKDKTSKCDEIRKIKMRNQEDIETFFDQEQIGDANLKSSFESRLKKIGGEMAIFKDKQREIEKRTITSELKRKTLFDDLRSKEAKLRECEDKLLEFSECFTSTEDIDRFDEINEVLEADHKNIVGEKGFLMGIEKTYNRFLSTLEERSLKENRDSSCPVCMRCFKNQDELDETIRELKKANSRMPQKINDLEVKIESSKAKLENLRSLKPEKQLYNEMKNGELKKLQKELDNYDKNLLPKLKAELKVNDEQLRKFEKLKACAENIQNEIVLIDKYLNESKDLERKINEKQKSSISTHQNESVETLESEKGRSCFFFVN